MFSLYNSCFKRWKFINEVELIRKRLSANHSVIHLQDYGAGSKKSRKNPRTIKQITKASSSTAKNSSLIKSLIEHLEITQAIELGTNLGLNTAYMANATGLKKLTTFEGDPSLLSIASENIASINPNCSVHFVQGNIDTTLPKFLSHLKSAVGLVFIDANHTYKATLQYFEWITGYIDEKSILVFDDINWSKEMNNAWKEIKESRQVTLSVETFQYGIVFFNKALRKENWVLEY